MSHKDFIKDTKKLITNKEIRIIEGGKTRQESVFNGLNKAQELNPDNVLIHDAVRPFFRKTTNRDMPKFAKYEGVVPSLNINDSIRYNLKNKYKNINRDNLKLIQTLRDLNLNQYSRHIKNLKRISSQMIH